MPHITFDLALILIMVFFVAQGVWQGFVHGVGSLVGSIVGLILAARFYERFVPWMTAVTHLDSSISKIVTFVVVYMVISKGISLLLWLLEKLISGLHIIPFFGLFNRIGGGILGFVEGVLMVGVAFNFALTLSLPQDWKTTIEQSQLATATRVTAKIIWPFVEKGLKNVETKQ